VVDGGDLRTFDPLVKQVIGDRDRGEAMRRMQEQFDRVRDRAGDRGGQNPGGTGGLPEPRTPPR